MKQISHESASKHVSGAAVFIDDMPVSNQLLFGRVVYSPHAHAKITSFDILEAKKSPGVHAVLCFKDIPGRNQMGPVVEDELCLAIDEVTFVGQAIFLIAAETESQARAAEKLIHIEYELLEPILTIEQAIEKNSLLGPPRTMQRGNAVNALGSAPHVLKGELQTGAHDHWYLESQISLCVPGEHQEMNIFSGTQNPTETQILAAEVLGIPLNEVVVEIRRMGGAFGGKETQANHVACWCALLAYTTKRPVKIRLFRDDDMIMTGKRHRFLTRYEVGFDENGKLLALKLELNSDGGAATDLSFAIMERAMLHVDNAYYIPDIAVLGRVWKTNLPSNTAFRGFGGPQGMAVIEAVIDRIARYLKKDALDIRHANFYGLNTNNITQYGQTIEDNRLFVIYDQLIQSSDYYKRRNEIDRFNAEHEFKKKGLACTPVKFGISFTTTFLNQAGALVNVFTDGTILVNHGGTEMGQGLHTKIQQIAAAEFGVSIEHVKVNATNTSKVPNTSATAASSGTDLNGAAVKHAIETLKFRIAGEMAKVLSEKHPGPPTLQNSIIFQDDMIIDSLHPDRRMKFEEVMNVMRMRQISLSATGYYRTPEIGWDKQQGWGKPFYYFSFGMCVSEILLDTLTGQHTLLRVDIVHDAGTSLNPLIDRGQIEGGFIQGVGWCTTEEIKWDDKGRLMTHSPDTYKIPTVRDIPKDFRVEFLQGYPNPVSIRQSKTVAEPPLMYGLSTWLAIKDAVSATKEHTIEPEFSLPATNEVILLSIEQLNKSFHQ